MDFVTLWKVSSILLTGAFGILGLVKEFKEKETGKITKWGKISLIGIVVSTGLGIAAQLKESSSQARAQENAVKQTLLFAEKNDQAVRDIQRSLYRLDEPRFRFGFEVPCENSKFTSFCSSLRACYVHTSPKDFAKWSGDPHIMFHINIFADRQCAQAVIAGKDCSSDLGVFVLADAEQRTLELFRAPDRITALTIPNYQPVPPSIHNNGRIKSILDLPHKVMLITWEDEEGFSLSDLRFYDFTITLKTAEQIFIDTTAFEKITVQGRPAYFYVFPPR